MWLVGRVWVVCRLCLEGHVGLAGSVCGWQGRRVAGQAGVWLVGHVWLVWPVCGYGGAVLGWWPSVAGWPCVAGQPSVAGVPGVAGRPYCISGPTAADRPCVARGLWAVADVSCGVGRPRLSDAPWLCDSPFLASGLCLAGLARVRLWGAVLGWWPYVAVWHMRRWPAICGRRARCGRSAILYK